MSERSAAPTREDLLAVSAYSVLFDEPDFVAGEWIESKSLESGVIALGFWKSSAVVEDWHSDLYEHHIIDPASGYLTDETVALVHRLMESPATVFELDLPTLRRAMTFVVRAERHTGGGWFENAFNSGFAQSATKRLGELAK